MTPENLEASGVQSWYRNWTQANANGPLFATRGKVNYFGIMFLQDEDYLCGLGFNGCNRRLLWGELMKVYPEDPGFARKVYFVTKMHNIVNLVVKVIYVSTIYAL